MNTKNAFFGMLALAVLLVSMTAQAVPKALERKLHVGCGGLYDLCGYHERGSSAVVIPAMFERAMPFSEGLAAVRIRGRFGYIDASGKIVIPARFDLAGAFFNDLAEVVIDGKAGVINRLGELVVEPQFARAIPFTPEVIIVSAGDWRRKRYLDHERLDGFNSTQMWFSSEIHGLYHIKKGWIARPQFRMKVFETEGRGLIWATESSYKHGPWGLLRSDGSWQVSPAFNRAGRLMEGRAIVGTSRGNIRYPLSGAVDEHGRLVVPMEFESLSYWRAGYGLAKSGGKTGLVDNNGGLLGGRYFSEVDLREDGLLPRVQIEGQWKSMKPDGTLVDDQLDGVVDLACPSGLTSRHQSGKLQFLAADGSTVADILFDDLFYSPHDCNKPISVRAGGKWGFITQQGRLLTSPLSFEDQHNFHDGFAIVEIDGRWGVIDMNGDMIIDPQFEKIDRNSNGIFRVTRGGRTFWINARGREVPEPYKDLNARRHLMLKCAGGATLATRNGQWGIAAQDGQMLVEAKYEAIDCFRHGLVWVPDHEKRQWCPLGPDGQGRDWPKCRKTYYPPFLSHTRPEKLAEDPFLSSVKWNIARLEYGSGRRKQPPYVIHRNRPRQPYGNLHSRIGPG